PETGWAVWIGHYKRDKWKGYWGSNPFLYLSDNDKRRRPGKEATFFNSHISTQVIGELFIHVIRSPARSFIDGWRFSPPHKGTLFRIWPPSGVSIAWPARTMTDHDADYVASALFLFLQERGRLAALRDAGQASSP
ncbi:MAG TPA: hypothetical protein VLX85_09570, partial [Stellaceae bacterium]|nr:hypothetical protein [Stellaceae bacterium]